MSLGPTPLLPSCTTDSNSCALPFVPAPLRIAALERLDMVVWKGRSRDAGKSSCLASPAVDLPCARALIYYHVSTAQGSALTKAALRASEDFFLTD